MYEEQIARGLAWLRSPDAAQFSPDLSRVDLDTLDMSSTAQCVLGQAISDPNGYHTGYNHVWETLFEQGGADAQVDGFMADHGFKAEFLDFEGYVILRQEWREALTAERTAS